MPVKTFEFKDQCLKLLDQRKLPCVEAWIECRDARKVYWAIQNMVVRGAPAIGIAGGYGLYLGVMAYRGNRKNFMKELRKVAAYLKSSRPTGVNLRNVIDVIVERIKKKNEKDVQKLKQSVLGEAQKAHREDDQICRSIGRYGAKLFKNGEGVLTHCNAGGLATSGYGTALGVIYGCFEKGKRLNVYADETRPLLQGARLTAWELKESGIRATVICDNMAASLIRSGKIDRIVVGADRIAANGDTANKIGTYNLAVLARVHKIPFYIAAPSTTFDFKIKSGKQIPIEERHAVEITDGFGRRTVPIGVRVWNPAFDVTPHAYIAAFITEAGILRPPFAKSFKKLKAVLEMP